MKKKQFLLSIIILVSFYTAYGQTFIGGEITTTTLEASGNPLLGDLSRLLNDSGLELDSADLKLGSEAFAQLLKLLQGGTITNSTAKEVLRSAFETGAEPESIVTEKGLGAMENDGELAAIVRKIIADNAKIVAEYRGGKSGAINALLGLVMKETIGRANAGEVRSLLQAELDQAS
jgi:aspartyl-tRNA(Asn)/glutamyl-tRNA(Gln) amidotransferase subunit B